jgi:MGT family glycosyltransferase
MNAIQRSRRFLFAMWEGGGNVPPMLGVAERLIQRGHCVRVLGDPTIQAEAEQIGCSFTPWRRAPHRTDLRPESDLLKDWETKNPISMLRRFRDVFLVAPAAAYAADTLEALEREQVDVLVPEYTLFGAMMAAEKLRIPSAPLVPNIWPLLVRGAPPFGPGFLPAKTALGRARDALLYALTHHLFQRGLPKLNRARRELGLLPLASFFDQVLNSDALFVLSSAAFDFSSPFVPGNVRYVGPVLDDPLWAEPWSPPWDPANRDPIVLVALSTTFQDQGASLRRIVDALARLRVRGLVTLGEMLPADAVRSKGSVVVVRSAPHREILPSAALVLTHCGHGTTLKALAAGVPMVCLPMGRDQNDTAARVVHHGAGLRLSPNASVAAIASAVERVLGDENYRIAARQLGQLIAAECAQIDVAVELERVESAEVRSRRAAAPVRVQGERARC